MSFARFKSSSAMRIERLTFGTVVRVISMPTSLCPGADEIKFRAVADGLAVGLIVLQV